MKNINEIKKLIQSKRQYLQDKYKISKIGIFGSVTRNEITEDSDIDILVEFYEPIGLDFVLLADELESLLGNKVDLVSSNSIKQTMKRSIEDDLIYV